MEKVKLTIGGEDYSARYASVLLRQELGWHHSVEVRVPLADTADKFKGVLGRTAKDLFGKPLRLSLGSNGFAGLVTGVSLNRVRRQENELVITGGSPTLAMDEAPHTVSFYEQTLKQIADTLITQYRGQFRDVQVSPKSKEKIKYTVQYRESNYQFLARLAASYGEWFYYDGEKVWFGTKPPPPGDKMVKLYQDKNLLGFDLAIRTAPVNFRLSGYDYKKHAFLDKEAAHSGKLGDFARIAFDKSKSELYPRTGLLPIHESLSEKDLDQRKTLREQAQVTGLVVLTGSSTEETLKVGSYVQLLDERSDLVGSTEDYGQFIVTRVEHSFGREGDDYCNDFEAVPAEVDLPPFGSPTEPPYCEMQLAEVVENNDPDAMGRVRVQFLWQRGTDQQSPWVRVASLYSGKDKGMYVVPEAGDQVVVAFEHNHPDRPYVLTGLYNGESKPEHHNSGNHLKALKTKGGNALLMNDEKGKESFGITSPKDVSVTATAGKMVLTGKEAVTVESTASDVTITSPGTVTIHAKTIVLAADEKISLAAPQIECTADGEFKAAAPAVTLEAGNANTIKGGQTVTIEGTMTTSIAGGMIKLN